MMESDRLARIHQLVAQFRSAAADPRTRLNHSGYANFPKSSCTWASFALGHLLMELEPQADWHIVHAPTSTGWGGGHDWLESNGLAVDVTADQFDGMDLYIGPSPAPIPRSYSTNTERYELSDWHAPHEEALGTVRDVMRIQSGG